MTGVALLLTALLVSTATVVNSKPVENHFDAMMYLTYYGYIQRQTDDGTGMGQKEMQKGIMDFQYMANLEQTGELDEATMEKMNLPRCGMPDNIGHAIDARRKKRFSLGSRWSRTDLTYRIINRTPDIGNPADVDETLTAALKVWSDVTPLTFTRITGNTRADIDISFVPGDRDHGDRNPFDGPSGVLAHAFFPENGDAHFDESERWTINTNAGINLFQVAAHEFGHSLGLGHSEIPDALMAAFYRGYVPNFQLHRDDIAGIRAHYGVGSREPLPTMEPDPPIADIPCTGRVDTVTTTRDRSTYVFEGRNVWKIEISPRQIADGFPKSIASTFDGLPNNVDAALFDPSNFKTYFFKGDQYWQYDNERLDSGFPRPIAGDWGTLPANLDAAFVWSGNGRIYFIKGNEYYRVNRVRTQDNYSVDRGYPRPLRVWNIPGNQVSAVVQATNRMTYFLAPNGDYFPFNDQNFQVVGRRPVSVDWQGCPNTLEEAPTTPTTPTTPDSGVSGRVPSLLALALPVVLGTAFF